MDEREYYLYAYLLVDEFMKMSGTKFAQKSFFWMISFASITLRASAYFPPLQAYMILAIGENMPSVFGSTIGKTNVREVASSYYLASLFLANYVQNLKVDGFSPEIAWLVCAKLINETSVEDVNSRAQFEITCAFTNVTGFVLAKVYGRQNDKLRLAIETLYEQFQSKSVDVTIPTAVHLSLPDIGKLLTLLGD